MTGRTGPNHRFEQVRPVRLYQKIVDQIEAAIAGGDLVPGQHLPSERELVEQFGASRPTVREALRVLEAGGVVGSRPGDPRGPEVLPFSSDGLAKQMERLAHTEQLTIAQLVAFRMIVDGSACRLAARLRTPDQLAAIEETIVAMAESVDAGFPSFSAADVAFHEAIAQASRNPMLEISQRVVRGVVLELIEKNVAGAFDSDELIRGSLQHHRDVLAAIRAGDASAASRIARQGLFDFYAPYVPASERAQLASLLDTPPT